MLRGNLQLTGNMILHQFPEKTVVRICQKIVEPNAAADKDPFDARQCPQLSQQGQIVAVIGDQVLAGGGKQTLPGGTGAGCQLLFTGWLPEIGSGAAYVMNIALKLGILSQQLGFP